MFARRFSATTRIATGSWRRWSPWASSTRWSILSDPGLTGSLSAGLGGLWQIRKHGLLIETLPGWVLVWLGCEAFLKLSAPHGADPTGAPQRPASGDRHPYAVTTP
jgi:hypothetical protein